MGRNKLSIIILIFIILGSAAFLIGKGLDKRQTNSNETATVFPEDKPQVVSTKPDSLEGTIISSRFKV